MCVYISGYMENAMDNTTSMTTPPEQVDTLIAQVITTKTVTILILILFFREEAFICV